MTKLKTRFFELEYENGAVRRIKNNGIEIIRMIYSAVRDQNWGTVEPEIIGEKIHQMKAGFRVDVRLKYKKDNIDFVAGYLIAGVENRLTFEMKGVSHSSFKTNRVGFCVLHPIKECAGKVCTVFHPDGSLEKANFPEIISPLQPVKNISEMEWEPASAMFAKLSFSGEIFEMEDQRNWADASYKTYCRPLEFPFPFEIKKGDKVQQKIVLELDCEPQTEIRVETVLFKTDNSKIYQLPAIGAGCSSRPETTTKNEAKILNQFSFDHLRAEIHLFKPEWKTELVNGIAESNLLNAPLFLVIYFSKHVRSELKKLVNEVQKVQLNVKYILVVAENHLPDDDIFRKVYPELKTIFPEAKIGAGVNAYFAELNRNRPNSEQAEFISFAVCPQVHAFDNVSLVENLEAQKYVVESAKKLFPGKPVFVSPVTLKQRFNVVATSEETAPQPGELPPQVDVRQNSVFVAQWLLASLKYLAQSGTGLVTYFETVGWRGFIQGDFNPPVPDKFFAQKGEVFPVFQLLREFSGFEQVIFSESDSPLEVDGIVLIKRNKDGKTKQKILLANFSTQTKKVKISGFDDFFGAKTLFSEMLLKRENDIFEIPSNNVAMFSNLV